MLSFTSLKLGRDKKSEYFEVGNAKKTFGLRRKLTIRGKLVDNVATKKAKTNGRKLKTFSKELKSKYGNFIFSLKLDGRGSGSFSFSLARNQSRFEDVLSCFTSGVVLRSGTNSRTR